MTAGQRPDGTPAPAYQVTSLLHRRPELTWRAIPGYVGQYEVSDQGDVKSLRFNRNLRPYLGRNGYFNVSLCDGQGHQANQLVHRLVLLAFVGPRPAGLISRHLDGNKLHNALENLRYGTYGENALDAVNHGQHSCARKTHCKQGHEFTPENTIAVPDGRRCRTCAREANRRYRRRRSAAAAQGDTR